MPKIKEMIARVMEKWANGYQPIRSVENSENEESGPENTVEIGLHIPFPDEIREARLEIRLTQEEAAQIAGVSESDWEKWESPTWSDQYCEPYGVAWNKFLRATAELRERGSKFRFAENYYLGLLND